MRTETETEAHYRLRGTVTHDSPHCLAIKLLMLRQETETETETLKPYSALATQNGDALSPLSSPLSQTQSGTFLRSSGPGNGWFRLGCPCQSQG